ncbi:unnamed protein product, partial [marine sediment metagenome]
NMIKVMKILGEEPHISSILTTINPGRYASEKLTMDDVVKSFANTISQDSNNNIISIFNSSRARKDTIDLIDEFYVKAREYGIMIYDSARAAAISIFRLWNYGKYLESRN